MRVVKQSNMIEIIHSSKICLEYNQGDIRHSYTNEQLILKGYSYKKNKRLKGYCWHDYCGWNIGHDNCKLPHDVLSEDAKNYKDRTRAAKDINKSQLSNRTVGIMVGGIVAILCAFAGFIIREFDPSNIKNVNQAERLKVERLLTEIRSIQKSQNDLHEKINTVQLYQNKNTDRILNIWVRGRR